MKTPVFVFSVLCAAGLLADILSITPVPQGGSDTNGWWWKRFNEKQKLVKAGGSEVVFMGDSITDFWGQYRPAFFTDHNYLCRGIGAQTVDHLG